MHSTSYRQHFPSVAFRPLFRSHTTRFNLIFSLSGFSFLVCCFSFFKRAYCENIKIKNRKIRWGKEVEKLRDGGQPKGCKRKTLELAMYIMVKWTREKQPRNGTNADKLCPYLRSHCQKRWKKKELNSLFFFDFHVVVCVRNTFLNFVHSFSPLSWRIFFLSWRMYVR